MENTKTDKPLIIEVETLTDKGMEWVKSEFTSLIQMKEQGYTFAYADLEEGYTVLVLTRNGYMDRFRIVGREDIIQ